MAEEKLFNRNFIICVIVQLLFAISFHLATPLIASYVVDLGETAAVAGLIAGMFSILAIIFRPFVGYMSDHADNKRMLTLGFAVYVVSYFGYAFAPNAGVLAAFRAFNSFGLCICSTVLTVVVASFIPKERMAEGIGYIGLATGIGGALGPGIGVAMADLFGYRTSYIIAGVIMLCALLILQTVPVSRKIANTKHEKLSINSFFAIDALPIAFTAAAFAFCAGMTTSLLVVSAEARGIEGVATFFFVASIGSIAARPAMGRLVDKRGARSICAIFFVAEAACMVLVAFAKNFLMLMLGGVGRIFGQLSAQSALQGQMFREIPENRRGVANATFYMGVDIGQGGGAILGGIIADAFGYTNMYLSGIIVLALGAIVFYTSTRKKKQNKDDVSASAENIEK